MQQTNLQSFDVVGQVTERAFNQKKQSINPFMPSVPKNGTPTLTVNGEIIQALMG